MLVGQGDGQEKKTSDFLLIIVSLNNSFYIVV